MFIKTCETIIINITTGDVYKLYPKDTAIMLNGKTITSDNEHKKTLALWDWLVSKSANPIYLADTIE